MSEQTHLFPGDSEATRTLLDQLLTDSRLYTKSKDYADLLAFVVKLRNFAPFNAMLLQVQKPGLSFAASARDWRERAPLSDHVFHNDGTVEAFLAEVDADHAAVTRS